MKLNKNSRSREEKSLKKAQSSAKKGGCGCCGSSVAEEDEMDITVSE